jgi:hypothetical protein
MAEQAFEWCCDWLLEVFLALRDRAKVDIFDQTQPQIQPSMTHMAQMILSKPLFIIVWMNQEMMRWLSLSRLFNGVVVGLTFA